MWTLSYRGISQAVAREAFPFPGSSISTCRPPSLADGPGKQGQGSRAQTQPFRGGCCCCWRQPVLLAAVPQRPRKEVVRFLREEKGSGTTSDSELNFCLSFGAGSAAVRVDCPESANQLAPGDRTPSPPPSSSPCEGELSGFDFFFFSFPRE